MRDVRTLDVGLDVHPASRAVAYARETRDAEGVFWGRIGTRQRDLDTRLRALPSQATPLGFGYEAVPGG